MATTILTDLQTPEQWTASIGEQTAEKSAYWQSGVVVDVSGDPSVAAMLRGGSSVNNPFLKDLTGNSARVNVDGTTEVTTKKVTSGNDIAPVFFREAAWEANLASANIANQDPVTWVEQQVGAFWARDYDDQIVATLKGACSSAAFAAAQQLSIGTSTAANVGATTQFNGDTAVDAEMLLGENYDRVSLMIVHPKTFAKMRKDGLIDYITPQNADRRIPVYQEKEVVVSANAPVSGSGATAIYETFFLTPGALHFGEAPVDYPVEMYREEKLNNSGFIGRRRYMLHPNGISFTGTIDANGPENSDLSTAGNWTLVYEPQNVRIVSFKHNV